MMDFIIFSSESFRKASFSDIAIYKPKKECDNKQTCFILPFQVDGINRLTICLPMLKGIVILWLPVLE